MFVTKKLSATAADVQRLEAAAADVLARRVAGFRRSNLINDLMRDRRLSYGQAVQVADRRLNPRAAR